MYDLLAPYIAAILASWLTYVFTIRSARRAFADQRRFEAVEKIYKELLSLQHYYEAKSSEVRGFKRGWFLEGNVELQMPLRELLVRYRLTVAANEIYLPRGNYFLHTVENLISGDIENESNRTESMSQDTEVQLKGNWAIVDCILQARAEVIRCIGLPMS